MQLSHALVSYAEACATLCVEASHSKSHLAKFGGHRSFGSRDITDLFHVTLQDHVIKEPCEFMDGSS